MAARVILLASILPAALCFSDTYPVVAWSSHRTNTLDVLPSKLYEPTRTATLLESILNHDEICDHEVVILVEHPGLHWSDLRALTTTSTIIEHLTEAPSSRQYPYSTAELSVSDSLNFVNSVSSRCGSRVVSTSLGQDRVPLDPDAKHVVHIQAPQIHDGLGSRKMVFGNLATQMANELELFQSSFNKHLVIIIGSPIAHEKRQLLPTLSRDISLLSPTVSANDTFPSGGILKRYQLLTPSLILSLAVVFFLLIPIVLVGISALSGIQSPLRVEAPKGYNADTKKNQ